MQQLIKLSQDLMSVDQVDANIQKRPSTKTQGGYEHAPMQDAMVTGPNSNFSVFKSIQNEPDKPMHGK